MQTQSMTIPVSPGIGEVSGIVQLPDRPKAMIVLAHGAGAGMHHRFMESLANALAQHDIATWRFNFPFTEQGKRRPDMPAVAQKTVAVMLEQAHEKYPRIPLFAAGKSFGGRMASHYLATHHPPYVRGIVCYGFPLHPPGKNDTTRAAHLGAVQVPMLFLQGTRDTLAEIGLMKGVCDGLPTATLVEFQGADHSFKAGKTDLIPPLAAATDDWIAGR
jgi:hypothetical protein